jgi:RNA-dependent RNA polymerase
LICFWNFKAHCPRVTQLLDDKQISQGIRYELARLVSTGKITYHDLTAERLEALRGSNRDAAGKIGSLFTRLDDTGDLSTDSAFAQELASHVSSASFL